MQAVTATHNIMPSYAGTLLTKFQTRALDGLSFSQYQNAYVVLNACYQNFFNIHYQMWKNNI